MATAATHMTDEQASDLLRGLGGAPSVTYAPPSVYPMAAPSFVPAAGAERPVAPQGPLGLYVHLPFCRYKCTFCFYATELVPGMDAMERYVAGIERELEAIPPGTELRQLYVGGGTPTALPPHLLGQVLAAVFARVRRGTNVATVECSPDSLTSEHVAVLLKYGIGRVSMGVQSDDDSVRDAINRPHERSQTKHAIRLLVDAGLMVNVDLIYGLPGQDERGFQDDVARLADLGVHSLTTYNLRVNEQTPVGRRLLPEERLTGRRLVHWREVVRDAAVAADFERTRWHTWRRRSPSTAAEATLGFRDLTGWGDQFSVGLSARSRLRDVVYRNLRERGAWLSAVEEGLSPVAEMHALDESERRLRYVTLTLGEGARLDRAAYAEEFGSKLDDDFGPALSRLSALGVLDDDSDGVELTERGALVYDLAILSFYPEPVRVRMAEREAKVRGASNVGLEVRLA